MPEINYLKHILNKKDIPNSIKKLGKKFLSLKNETELKEFANKLKIKIDGLNFNELREKMRNKDDIT